MKWITKIINALFPTNKPCCGRPHTYNTDKNVNLTNIEPVKHEHKLPPSTTDHVVKLEVIAEPIIQHTIKSSKPRKKRAKKARTEHK